MWLEQQYAPEERIIRIRKANHVRRLIITGIFLGLMGAAAGTLGSGGGMFFVNIIMNAWGAKVCANAHWCGHTDVSVRVSAESVCYVAARYICLCMCADTFVWIPGCAAV
jgi:ABC-type lipoprotein release transport system permease subunit